MWLSIELLCVVNSDAAPVEHVGFGPAVIRRSETGHIRSETLELAIHFTSQNSHSRVTAVKIMESNAIICGDNTLIK